MRSTIKKVENFSEVEKFRIQMKKEHILQNLKNQGYRVTKPRIAVIDIILEHGCGSCKEITYWISKMNKSIGIATIYRTLNMLEDIGALHRQSVYHLSDMEERVVVRLENGTELSLSQEEWQEVIQKGMEICGFLKGEKILSVEYKHLPSAN